MKTKHMARDSYYMNFLEKDGKRAVRQQI